jgi:hypothetical protein
LNLCDYFFPASVKFAEQGADKKFDAKADAHTNTSLLSLLVETGVLKQKHQDADGDADEHVPPSECQQRTRTAKQL